MGPPSSMVCGDRTSTWQLWHPSLEAELDAHCSELSTVARIAAALNALIDKMREGVYQVQYLNTILMSIFRAACKW